MGAVPSLHLPMLLSMASFTASTILLSCSRRREATIISSNMLPWSALAMRSQTLRSPPQRRIRTDHHHHHHKIWSFYLFSQGSFGILASWKAIELSNMVFTNFVFLLFCLFLLFTLFICYLCRRDECMTMFMLFCLEGRGGRRCYFIFVVLNIMQCNRQNKDLFLF